VQKSQSPDRFPAPFALNIAYAETFQSSYGEIKNMSQTPVKPDWGSPPSTPRWVKVFGISALILILLISIIIFTGIGGEHGPGRHRAVPTSTTEVQQP